MWSFEPRFTITNAITAALTEIERARGFLEAAALAEEWVEAMRARAFLLEAYCPCCCSFSLWNRRISVFTLFSLLVTILRS